MVDARAGLTSSDIGIAHHLRRQKKKVFLVANKTDGIDGDAHVGVITSYSIHYTKLYDAGHR